MSDAPGAAVLASGRWTPAERLRLSGILAVVAGMHVLGWTLYLGYSASLPAASSFAGAGTLAYALGVRHAFDADHIAAIDDTTRLMLLRGRRPVGVGFFIAMGHSSVVLLLALVVAFAAGAAGTQGEIDAFRSVGGAVSVVVAMSFLLLVAALNALVLRGILLLWRRMTRGELDAAEIDRQLLNRGLLNRLLGGRARTLIRSSWHMYPLGFLFGLGLETASEVTLLTLSASAAVAGGLPVLATLTLPLLVAGFVGTVYLAGILVDYAGAHALAPYAALSQRFQLLGYGIVAAFVLAWLAWLAAAAVWRFGGLARRYGGAA